MAYQYRKALPFKSLLAFFAVACILCSAKIMNDLTIQSQQTVYITPNSHISTPSSANQNSSSNNFINHSSHVHSEHGSLQTEARELANIDPDHVYASDTVLGLHKWVLFFGWGIVVDLSVFIARYCKTWKHYLGAHAALFLLLDISTIVFVALMLSGNSDKLSHTDEMTSKTLAHYVMGIIILAIDVIVHFLGVALKHGIEGGSVHIPKIKKAHKVLGILLYIICKTNLVVGASIQDELPGGLIIIILSIVLMIIAEIYYRNKNSKEQGKAFYQTYDEIQMFAAGESNTEDQNRVMRLLNVEKLDVEQILSAVPSVKWVVYNSGVYDVTSFVHPGGQYLLTPVIGKEVGRYLNGSLPLEGFETPSYKHSAKSMQLLKTMLIGYLDYDESSSLVLVEDDLKQTRTLEHKLKAFNSFTLDKVEKISSHTSMFRFRSEERIQVKNVLKGVHWIGRHFVVKVANQEKSRLYTQIVSMTEDNINLRRHLIALTEAKISGNAASAVSTGSLPALNEFSSALPIIIKSYEFKGALSRQIHELNSRVKYEIQGPLGTGLGFSDRTVDKRFLLFVGGTGILPFLDLLDVLLKKSMVQLTKDQKALDPYNIGYDSFFKGCQFTMYASFHALEDFVGADWVAKLHEYSEKLGNNLFQLHLKISKGTSIPNIPKVKYNNFEELIQETIEPHSFDKAYICGSPAMFNSIIGGLKQKGVPADKIFNV